MATPADLLLDNYTTHSVNLMRVEAGLAKQTRRLLKKLERELVSKLKEIDPTDVVSQTHKFRRLERLLEQTRATIAASYSGFRGEVKNELVSLASLENRFNVSAINTALNVETLTVGLSRQALRDIVNTSFVQGTQVSEWVNRLSKSTQQRLSDALRTGMLAGESLGDLVRRIRGTAVPGSPGTYIGGVMSTSTREAEAFARTAAQTIANKTRDTVLAENRDVLRGREALVTLDMRTSDTCIARSGMAWDFDGNPIPGTNTTIVYPGPPPWHWQCRTTFIPVLKSWEELGARIKGKFPESTQASMNGQVSGKLNYEGWLKKQPVLVQKQVLGKTKYSMWKKGQIKSFRDLIDQTGRPLTVAELAARYDRVLTRLAVPDTAPTVTGTFYRAKQFKTPEEADAYLQTLRADIGKEKANIPSSLIARGVYDSTSVAETAAWKAKNKVIFEVTGDVGEVKKGFYGIRTTSKVRIQTISNTPEGRVVRIEILSKPSPVKPKPIPVAKKVAVKKTVVKKKAPVKKKAVKTPTPKPLKDVTTPKNVNGFMQEFLPKADYEVRFNEYMKIAVPDMDMTYSKLSKLVKTIHSPSPPVSIDEIFEARDTIYDFAKKLHRYLLTDRWMEGSMQWSETFKTMMKRIDMYIRFEDNKYLTSSAINTIKGNLRELLLLNKGMVPDTLRSIVRSDPRGYASKFYGEINVGSNVTDKRVLFHEFGHHMEYTLKDAVIDAKRWVRDRAVGKKPLNKLVKGSGYRKDEIAWHDDFINPYVGKVYKDATEVLSMGLEHFSSVSNLNRLISDDVEHFHFVLKYLF